MKIKFLLISLILVLSFPVLTVSADTQAKEDSVAKGIILKVNTRESFLLVNQSSRTVKFSASKELCEKVKNKTNQEVTIRYIKLKDGTLFAKDIIIK